MCVVNGHPLRAIHPRPPRLSRVASIVCVLEVVCVVVELWVASCQGWLWALFGTCSNRKESYVQGPGAAVAKEHLLPGLEGPSVQSGPADGIGNRTAAGQGALLETVRGPRIVDHGCWGARIEGALRRERRKGSASHSLTLAIQAAGCQEVLVPAEALTLAINASRHGFVTSFVFCVCLFFGHVVSSVSSSHANTTQLPARREGPGGYNVAKSISEICVAFFSVEFGQGLFLMGRPGTDCCNAETCKKPG